jgi:hypothetical protein
VAATRRVTVELMKAVSLLTLGFAIALVGCGSDGGGAGGSGTGGDAASTGTTDAASTSTGAGDGGGGGAPECDDPDVGLGACSASADCPQLYSHLGWTDEPAARACAGGLIASGVPGRLDAAYQPGPGGMETWWTIIARGDGSAWVQVRHLTYELGNREGTECWTVDPIELCEMEADCVCPDDEAPCDCTWDPGALSDAGCVPAEPEPTCEDVDALLARE